MMFGIIVCLRHDLIRRHDVVCPLYYCLYCNSFLKINGVRLYLKVDINNSRLSKFQCCILRKGDLNCHRTCTQFIIIIWKEKKSSFINPAMKTWITRLYTYIMCDKRIWWWMACLFNACSLTFNFFFNICQSYYYRFCLYECITNIHSYFGVNRIKIYRKLYQ